MHDFIHPFFPSSYLIGTALSLLLFLNINLALFPNHQCLCYYCSMRPCVSLPPLNRTGRGAALPKILHCGGNNGRQARPVSPPSLIWRVRPPTRRYCNFHSVAVVAVVAARGWRRWMWRFGRRLMGLMEGFWGFGRGKGRGGGVRKLSLIGVSKK